jgi:hypothetical protein
MIAPVESAEGGACLRQLEAASQSLRHLHPRGAPTDALAIWVVQLWAVLGRPVKSMLMDATHELQKLIDDGVRFSLALEHNGWFSIRIGNYLTGRFATSYSPTFELAVAALTRAAHDWPIAS